MAEHGDVLDVGDNGKCGVKKNVVAMVGSGEGAYIARTRVVGRRKARADERDREGAHATEAGR